MKNGLNALRVIVLVFFVLAALPAWAAVNQIPDVRVLIDISGSMKKSDPQNLRIPATRLIAGLMPDGSRCGVWTFGRYVNMLVPVRNVDDEWRELAREKSTLINSAGLYTNIEGVLENASSGWFEYDPNTKRNIILLSDGYVDVSKNPDESAESRRRIIEKTLPRLKKAGVIVHTVALSEDADHQLLETISVGTGGSYMKATEASQLNRLFLKLFEKSTEVPSLPLKNNKFKVDKSIKNMTLVIMQEGDAKPAAVILPGGKSFNQAFHPKTVKWHHENGFDLVTIESPVEGLWQIDANIDPDNRVIVATNIELGVSPLPNSIMPNEIIHIYGHMLEDGKPLIKRRLLDNIDMVLLQEQHNGTAQSIHLSDSGIPPDLGVGDGVFSATMKPLDVQGVYELSVIAVSPTFEREYRHTLQVMGEPVSIDVKELGADKDGIFLMTLTPRIDRSILVIESLTVKLADSEQPAVELPRDDNETWSFELPHKVEGKYLTFAAEGKIDGKREFSYEWDIAMPGVPPLPSVVTDVVGKGEVIIAQESVENTVIGGAIEEHVSADNSDGKEPGAADAQVSDHQEADSGKDAKSHDTNWALVIGIITGVNLLFAIGGGVWWWLARKRKKSGEVDEFEVVVPESVGVQAGASVSAKKGAEPAAKAESNASLDMNQDAALEVIEKAKEVEAEADKVA
ncbi:MAG: hypothetical protein COC05_06520 [Gammaproteobacteria bacterium]|nr:MAG: hypothetical protein COC05_06520 [Gammaproteobacteria bacterium]